MQLKSYICVFLISLICFALMIPLGTQLYGFGGHNLKFTITTVLYCYVAWYLLKRFPIKKHQIINIFLLSVFPLIAYAPLHIQSFNETLLSLPSTLAHFYGILVGSIIYFTTHPKFKIALIITLFASCIFMSFTGYKYWLSYVNFKTFTGNVSETPAPNYRFIDETGEIITNIDHKGKILVLDFWNTSCGICFKKFPILDSLTRSSLDKDVLYYAVNSPIKRDSATEAFNVLKNNHYAFKVLKMESTHSAKAFNIYTFPTVIVINADGNIIYRGDIEDAVNAVQK